jgi:hypothetical protein
LTYQIFGNCGEVVIDALAILLETGAVPRRAELDSSNSDRGAAYRTGPKYLSSQESDSLQ